MVKLGSIASIKTGKLDSNAAESDGIYPFFTCSPDTLRINTYAFDQEAILLAGNNAEGNYTAKYYSGKFNAYQRTYVISSSDSDVYSTRFIGCAITLALKQLKDVSQGTSTKFLTKAILQDLDIPDYSMQDQSRIVSIMGSLEDCIGVLCKINDNLDALLRALYSELFSDESIVEYGKLGTYCDVQKGLSYKGSGLSDSDGALLVNLGNITPGGGYRKEKEKYYTGEYKQKNIVQPGDLIIANTDMTYDRAILGSPIIVPDYPGTILFTHHLFAFRDLKLPKSYLYYCLRTDEFHGLCESSANGTTVLAINREDVLDATIPIPNSSALNTFDKIASVALKAMSENEKEVAKLLTLRDYLLPRLMSGEIYVSTLRLPTK